MSSKERGVIKIAKGMAHEKNVEWRFGGRPPGTRNIVAEALGLDILEPFMFSFGLYLFLI